MTKAQKKMTTYNNSFDMDVYSFLLNIACIEKLEPFTVTSESKGDMSGLIQLVSDDKISF